jgi:hypothetical protein
MHVRAIAFLAVAALTGSLPAAAAVTPYSQDFEGLIQSDPDALANDGWLVFGNVFSSGGDYLYGYGPYPAPNNGAAFCQIVTGEGGPEQGDQQLVVFSDYENTDHGVGDLIESNVYQEQTIETADLGAVWIFEFQAKLGNIEGSSTAMAFIKTLDPNNGYALTNFLTVDMTNIPTTWGGYSIPFRIDESLDGQLLQFGFMNTATDYEGSGIFYDNLYFHKLTDGVPSPDRNGLALRQNYPNPFNPETRIEFTLERPGVVTVSVYDVRGRRVAVLQEGELEAGEHHVSWDGRTDSGSPAAAGQYRYVLRTATGQLSRSMILLK